MGLNRHKSNPILGTPAIIFGHLAAAIFWVLASPDFFGIDPLWVKVAGALAICAMAWQCVASRRHLSKKALLPINDVVANLDAHIQVFLDEIPSNIAVVSTDGHYKYWSKAFRKNIMPNLSHKEIKEMQLLSEEYVALQTDGHPFGQDERPIVRAIKTGEKTSAVKAGIPSGPNQWTWVEMSVTPRKNPNGQVVDLICLFELMTGVHTAEADLAIQSFQDSLTGLPNRSLFTELLSRALFRTEKHRNKVGVMFLDLNRFKLINDSLGHKFGDKLLSQVSRRLRGAIKQVDTLARLGGDEFAILFEDLGDLNEAVTVSDWIQHAFEDPFVVDGEECYIGCSIGLAVASSRGVTAAELIRDAEVAMYRAKSKGSDAMEIYDHSMNEETKDRIKIETEMRHALHRNEFLLHYQPLIDLSTGKISGWESLIRWQHPERGIVFPGDFIGIAEETGLIMPLGAWILNEACRQAQDWRKRFPNFSESIMNVNLSIRQFQQHQLAEKIIGVLEVQQFDPKYLKLEITESHTMKDPVASLAIMKSLKAQHINLAIDDFGTDYSSLSYLKRMPVDTIKIDKSFIDGLGLDAESTAIVQAIISLAKALELTVTAEGIENVSQLSILKDMGCHIGQGYYFSRPVHPDQAEKLMEQNTVW
jgi:diguanylate cyclase (GGDEF)-like protein